MHRIDRIARIAPNGGTAPTARAVIVFCYFVGELRDAPEASRAAVPKRSRPAKRSHTATWSDSINQANPQNPDETSVSVACPSGPNKTDARGRKKTAVVLDLR